LVFCLAEEGLVTERSGDILVNRLVVWVRPLRIRAVVVLRTQGLVVALGVTLQVSVSSRYRQPILTTGFRRNPSEHEQLEVFSVGLGDAVLVYLEVLIQTLQVLILDELV